MQERESNQQSAPDQPTIQKARDPQESGESEHVLALLVEIARRAADQSSLDDLFFLLVNEFRSMLPFDRCFLVTHVGGKSSFVAASHQPTLETKSDVYRRVSLLAPHLIALEKGILLTKDVRDEHFADGVLGLEVRQALIAYVRDSRCSYFLCAPLVHRGSVVGHLLFHFFGETGPETAKTMVLLNVAPLFASILAQQLLLHKKPRLAAFMQPKAAEPTGVWKSIVSRPRIAIMAAGLLFLACMVIPINNVATGEAVVIPRQRHFAFCRIDGLIQTVLITEGSRVNKDQVLAALDPTESDFKLDTARRQGEMVVRRIGLVRREADSTPSKLGDLRILELESQKILREISHIEWERSFLAIKSPVDGIVLTKDVQAMEGKKLGAGEPFCEIARPDNLIIEIFVPEDKVSGLSPGQSGTVFLNHDPLTGHGLIVEEIPPAAEAMQRQGNGCRVRARFVTMPHDVRIGMKGVGKIYISKTTLGMLAARGVAVRWARIALHF